MATRLKPLLTALAACALAACLATTATAATLMETEGQVRVDRGDGFVAASNGSDLKAGDRIMVPANAQASVFFRAGCMSAIPAGTLYTVGDGQHCPNYDAEEGNEYGLDRSRRDAAHGERVIPDEVVVVGGIAVLGGIIWAIADDDDPSSP